MRRLKSEGRHLAGLMGLGLHRARGQVMRAAAQHQLRSVPKPRRLCLGSGRAPIDGWVNIDFEPPADVLLDLRFGIPVPDRSIDGIYSEHLIEHLPLRGAQALIAECYRILAPAGLLRIATPDLEELVTDYRRDWRLRQSWVNERAYKWVDSPVRMVNAAFREWGHQYLYDYDELALRLAQAGFADVRRLSIGESEDPAFRNLETRLDSGLIVEARIDCRQAQ